MSENSENFAPLPNEVDELQPTVVSDNGMSEAEKALISLAGVQTSSGSSSLAGAHAALVTDLVTIVGFAQCARGNHSWIRESNVKGIYYDPRTKKYAGSVTQKCNVCKCSLTIGPNAAPLDWRTMLPTDVILSVRDSISSIASKIKMCARSLVNAPTFKNYAVTEAFNSNNQAITKYKDKVLMIAKGIGSPSAVINSINGAFVDFDKVIGENLQG